jgi:hypothetical protein
MEKLGELIGRMVDDEEPAHGSGGLVPNKKMIVLAPKPFAAHVACAYIDQEFPNVGMSIVVSDVPLTRRSVLYGPFQTATVDELRQEHETPGPATPRILVTTLGIGAQGLNLARANYLVVLGPSWAESTHDQTFCRIDRDGQLFTPHLFMVLDSTNPAESLIRQRQLRRVTLETGVWGDDELIYRASRPGSRVPFSLFFFFTLCLVSLLANIVSSLSLALLRVGAGLSGGILMLAQWLAVAIGTHEVWASR